MNGYSKKEILRNGWQTPENMTNHDKICKPCLQELKKSQTRGKTYGKAVSMSWQFILAVIAPGLASLRISRWRKWMLYGGLPRYGIIFTAFVVYVLIVDSLDSIGNSFAMWIIIIFMFIGSPHEYYLIGKWTKERNKNTI